MEAPSSRQPRATWAKRVMYSPDLSRQGLQRLVGGFANGVVLDYDKGGNLVGIDIDEASTKLEIGEANLEQVARRGETSRVRH